MSNEAWNKLTELAIIAGMNERYWAAQHTSAESAAIYSIFVAFLAIVFALVAGVVLSSRKTRIFGIVANNLGLTVFVISSIGFAKPSIKESSFAADMVSREPQMKIKLADAD